MDNPPTDPLIVTTWITSTFAFLGILTGAIFTYLAVLENNKKNREIKETTKPLKPVDIGRIAELEQQRREDEEAYAIALRVKDKEIEERDKIIAAHQVWGLRLTRQMRHHAPDINPVDYEPPNGHELTVE